MASSDLGPEDQITQHRHEPMPRKIAAAIAGVLIALALGRLYLAPTSPFSFWSPDAWFAYGCFTAAILVVILAEYHRQAAELLGWAAAALIEHWRDIGFAAALVGAFVGLWFFVDRSESLSELFGRRRLMQWRDAVILAAFLVAIVAAVAARSKGIRLTLHRLSGLAATLGVVALAVGAPMAVMHYADLTEFFKGQDELLKAGAASVGVLGVVYVLKMWFAALQKFMGQFSDQVFALMQGAAGRKPIRPTATAEFAAMSFALTVSIGAIKFGLFDPPKKDDNEQKPQKEFAFVIDWPGRSSCCAQPAPTNVNVQVLPATAGNQSVFTMAPPDVKIGATNINMPAPKVTVLPAPVNVAAPKVDVAAPKVTILPQFTAPDPIFIAVPEGRTVVSTAERPDPTQRAPSYLYTFADASLNDGGGCDQAQFTPSAATQVRSEPPAKLAKLIGALASYCAESAVTDLGFNPSVEMVVYSYGGVRQSFPNCSSEQNQALNAALGKQRRASMVDFIKETLKDKKFDVVRDNFFFGDGGEAPLSGAVNSTPPDLPLLSRSVVVSFPNMGRCHTLNGVIGREGEAKQTAAKEP